MSMIVPDPQTHDDLTKEHPLEAGPETLHDDYSAVRLPGAVRVAECPACGKWFTSGANLDRHLANNRACTCWLELGTTAMRTARAGGKVGAVRAANHPTVFLTGNEISAILRGVDASCMLCKHAYADNSSLNRHYKTSSVCDHFRGLRVAEAVARSK